MTLTVARDLKGVIDDAKPRLGAITEGRASAKPYPDKWSLKEILGHLLDSATNNRQRIIRMQEFSDIGVFTYDQEPWVALQHYHSEPWAPLVEFWYLYNAHIAHMMAHVKEEALAHTCDMGYAAPATLRFVMEDYVRHLRHHLEQIFTEADPRQREQWVMRTPEG
ncbi:MAG TPA: DinB family protein [Bacteroidota bacterium]|nr:DinB family protein [Bacteroidota bacterium]